MKLYDLQRHFLTYSRENFFEVLGYQHLKRLGNTMICRENIKCGHRLGRWEFLGLNNSKVWKMSSLRNDLSRNNNYMKCFFL